MSTFFSGDKSIHIDQHEPTTPGRHPAILLLHGSGGNVSFWSDRIAPHLTRLNVAFYAVHYFDRTGTTRAAYADIIDGHHFPAWLSAIADALAYIRTRPNIDPNRIALLGISLGAFLSLALATDPATNIRAIVEISGGLPDPYAANATSAFPPTLILHGGADTFVTVSDAHKLEAQLTALNVPHETHIFPNQGHWFDSPTQLQILLATARFLSQHL
jgi:carboxymethylenebutenolidase